MAAAGRLLTTVHAFGQWPRGRGWVSRERISRPGQSQRVEDQSLLYAPTHNQK